jgi:hypothetical protein
MGSDHLPGHGFPVEGQVRGFSSAQPWRYRRRPQPPRPPPAPTTANDHEQLNDLAGALIANRPQRQARPQHEIPVIKRRVDLG